MQMGFTLRLWQEVRVSTVLPGYVVRSKINRSCIQIRDCQTK
jgi:hypothetical protein